MIIFHDPHCVEYSAPGNPERPERIASTVPLLKEQHPDWEWRHPSPAPVESLLRAHSGDHVEEIKSSIQEFDADTPAYPDIYAHALRSAGAAIEATRAGLRDTPAMSLMRPPGHHATQDRAMGFCYFNNIAVAALDALENGAGRVAIWDFDAHHGNGTEAIVANNPRIKFASVHQSPGYPGTGLQSFGNIDNFPLRPYTRRIDHVNTVEQALQSLLAFKPNLILVSAGFDAFRNDPITQLTLEREDFATFGRWLGEIHLPAAAILEGGYSDELPILVDAFLTGWANGKSEPSGSAMQHPARTLS